MGGLSTATNAIYIRSGATNYILEVWSVRNQTAVPGNDEPPGINRRYIVLRCQRYDWPNMARHKKIRHDNDAAARFLSKRSYDGFDFSIALSARCDRLHFQ